MADTNISNVLEGGVFTYVFNLLKANVLRDRKTMSLVLLREETGRNDVTLQVKKKLKEIVREKDVLFQTEFADEIGLLLPHSGKEEAGGFLKRVQNSCPCLAPGTAEGSFQGTVLEVCHPEMTADRALAICRSVMDEAVKPESGADGIRVILAESPLGRPVVAVKVSILDGDRLFRDLLEMSVERIRVPGAELTIQTFGDGLALMQSGWTDSFHPHLVVMSDVLPKKNGLDVLHELREMPNEEKFTILMMTRRNSEEDMIYAYESGTDGYLVKPFNLRLFEAQIQRLLAGLWS